MPMDESSIAIPGHDGVVDSGGNFDTGNTAANRIEDKRS